MKAFHNERLCRAKDHVFMMACATCCSIFKKLHNWCLQSSTNLAMSSGKGAKDKQLNGKYAAWAADQIRIKYKVCWTFCLLFVGYVLKFFKGCFLIHLLIFFFLIAYKLGYVHLWFVFVIYYFMFLKKVFLKNDLASFHF